MSIKWTGNRSESGILRKSEFKEKKEELFVFGYSCKLFRDNEKALHIDQGKHLIPWMGDESLKIDRYDARGALHDLSSLEAPPGGYDWRVELTRAELDVEQLCDEERYRALHTDEDEEEMYKEEELKRLHAAGYGQVGFNYDTPQETTSAGAAPPVEVDEPFVPEPSFKALLPADMLLPETQKQNAIIEKTAKFIAAQGAQMEILIKAKQGDNPQFLFLNKDSTLNPYYCALISLVKSGKWPEKEQEVIEEKPQEPEEYLHPTLASTVIESAPSIPSIHYKPSADCDYTMLISKMRGETGVEPAYSSELAPGEVAPPGTEPLPLRPAGEISRAPVMYTRGHPAHHHQHHAHHAHRARNAHHGHHAHVQPPPPPPTPQVPSAPHYRQYAAYYPAPPAPPAPPPPRAPALSTGLSLMKNYNTDSDTDHDDSDGSSSGDNWPPVAIPPADVQLVIDKMAAYVARNGDEFAVIVRAKNDPRFTFLEPEHVYHAYYMRLMRQKRGVDVNGRGRKKNKIPVSFSIKKQKEPDPILLKPALPYESSSEDESDKQDKPEEQKEAPKPPQIYPINIPPVVVYKIENQNHEIPLRTVEPTNSVPKPPPIEEKQEKPKTPEEDKVEEKQPEVKVDPPKIETIMAVAPVPPPSPQKEVRERSLTPEHRSKEKSRDVESPRRERERRKQRVKKNEYRSKPELRETRRSERRSIDKEKRREKEADRKRRHSKDIYESEIISLLDNTDELIDLTGEQSDSKGEVESEMDKLKQQERRRRAAEFLKKVGVDPAAAALPATSLASAMVDTLESLRKKKVEEEEKRRKREKRRHRAKDRREYEDGSERSHRKSKRRKKSSDEYDVSDADGKKKKRKKDKKHSSKNRKKRRKEIEVEEEIDPPLNIDLTNTLKELRHASPTKDLVQDIEDGTQQSFYRDSSDDEERNGRHEKKRRRENREYSEGEWSSDTGQDSASTVSRKGE